MENNAVEKIAKVFNVSGTLSFSFKEEKDYSNGQNNDEYTI